MNLDYWCQLAWLWDSLPKVISQVTEAVKMDKPKRWMAVVRQELRRLETFIIKGTDIVVEQFR